jgi:charged multivesicular body protein 2A
MQTSVEHIPMSFLFASAPKPVRVCAKEKQRELRKEIRRITIEETKLKEKDTSVEKLLRGFAEKNNIMECKQNAIHLIRVRSQLKNISNIRRQLEALDLHITNATGIEMISSAMDTAARLTRTLNQFLETNSLSQKAKEMSLEQMKLNNNTDEMNEALNGFLKIDNEEEESAHVVNSLFEQLGLEIQLKMNTIPSVPIQCEPMDCKEDDTDARWAALKEKFSK